MKYLLLLTLVISSFSCATTKINSGETTYKVEGVNHTGYIASKVNKGEKKPGIIIVHEWWGHNEYARSRADMLADLGYVAMSIDMYGEGKLASHPKDAGSFAMKTMSNPKLAKEKFETALAILKSREDVDQSKIAAIGYCFGGGVVLAMARSGVDLDLIASFHGSLKTAAKVKKGQVKGEVLVFNGESDPMVTKDDIKKAYKKSHSSMDF